MTLATVRAADHRAFDVLRSAWCRSLTGEVLLLGRSAYPFVAVDRDEPGALVDLLAGAQGELAEPVPRLRRVWRDLRAPAGRGSRSATTGRRSTCSACCAVPRSAGRRRSWSSGTRRSRTGWPPPAIRDAAGNLAREIRPMTPDRARLAPMEPPDWVLDVMIGSPARSRSSPTTRSSGSPGRPAGQLHAAQRAAAGAAAAAGPRPSGPGCGCGSASRTGAGTRCASWSGSWPRWTALRSDGLLVHLREVPQMESLDATQTAPEDSFDELPGARVPTTGKISTGRLVTDLDIRVPAAPADSWRLVAVCAQPRSGLLAEVLGALHEHAGVRGLAGAISGVFDGTMVVFLLCRPAAAVVDPAAVAAGGGGDPAVPDRGAAAGRGPARAAGGRRRRDRCCGSRSARRTGPA